jgi:hypothetical protein
MNRRPWRELEFSPKEYENMVLQRVRDELQDTYLSYEQLVRRCRGAYPSVVSQCLDSISSDVNYFPTQGIHLQSSLNEGNSAEFQTELIENNPILASWYFTRYTCNILGRLRSWTDKKIAFLGTPRLYEWFQMEDYGAQRVLLDLDTVIVTALSREQANNKDIVLKYDVKEKLPDDLLGHFDYVFFDPPWYFETYDLWIRRSIELAPKGEVIFSLFPELTRPTASRERRILSDDLSLSLHKISLLTNFLEYETPTFEREQLKAAGFIDLHAWRLGDLVIAEPRAPLLGTNRVVVNNPSEEWNEVDLGKVRIFINLSHHETEPADQLLSLVSDSPLLPSPSKRTREYQKANVVSSRGHGLRTSDPKRLLKILQNIAAYSGSQRLDEVIDKTVDDSSVTLVKALCAGIEE